MNKHEFKNEIKLLISSNQEGDYWDFKQCHHSNTANLLHDIICMANNRVDRNAYIIFGVTDKDIEIVGIENDPNRRTQQQFIDQLKGKDFAGGIRPKIELISLNLCDHEIDVLIVENTDDTPYYLTSDYRDKDRLVRANYIYTRVRDTNTDINKSADVNHVEYLWKKRFLLNKPPLEQIKNKISHKEEWQQEGSHYYNIYNPEFTIHIEEEECGEDPEFYAYAMYNESVYYKSLEIRCYNTKLYSDQVVVLDSGRYKTPIPNWEFLHFDSDSLYTDYAFKYFIKTDIDYKLVEFLFNSTNHEELIAHRRLSEVILIFENLLEKNEFMNYLKSNHNELDNFIKEDNRTYRRIENNNELASQGIIEKLKTGKALNKILEKFRQNNFLIINR
ncbi:AlbA family DNA-binding domain-containing protein [Priestia megaterium]|uniref:AlbA family DNA-binding domain-containing protein n=1 Tax=Priestia megaterium TaxID=1404 RepID=UPI000EF98A40|nr:ATP-binding protein [Priestia megaterium]RMA90901.1 putative DNA-binding protein [Priestia megaterium]